MLTTTPSAVNENTIGMVQSFAIGADGRLSGALNSVTSGGNAPAFATALSTGQVAVMNYNSGTGRVVPTTNFGVAFDNSAGVISFPQPVGTISHPHMAVQFGNEIFVPDLVSHQTPCNPLCAPVSRVRAHLIVLW